MAQPAPEWISPEEYLRREWLSPTKNEYRGGRIYPLGEPPEDLPGGRRRRAQIAVNLAALLKEGLRGSPFEVYDSGIGVEGWDRGFDLVIAREPVFTGLDAAMLANPLAMVVIHWFGDDGRSTDLLDYERLAELREVWLVNANRRLVSRNQPLEPRKWLCSFHSHGQAAMEALGIGLHVEDVCEGVQLESKPPFR